MAEATSKNLPDWMRAHLSVNHRFLLTCLVTGLLCALTAVAFHFTIEILFSNLWRFANSQDPAVSLPIGVPATTANCQFKQS